MRLSEDAHEKVQQDCCPGKPFITYRTEPNVPLKLLNPQPYSGLFETTVPVFQGDTYQQILTRLNKMERSKVKDLSLVMMLRYEDPVVGPRQLPDMNNLKKGLVAISNSSVFSISVEKNEVTVAEGGKTHSVGQRLVYMFKSN